MENKKYDLEKAKEDCRRHEDALEEAQSCMCGHCHECGFDPSEMKAALDEVERLRSLEKCISPVIDRQGKTNAALLGQLDVISAYLDTEMAEWKNGDQIAEIAIKFMDRQKQNLNDANSQIAAKNDKIAQDAITIQMHHNNVLILQKEVERLRSDWRQEHATAETWKEDFKKMQKRLTDSELLRQAQYNQTAAKDARIKELGSEVERLRSHHIQIMGKIRAWILNDCAEVCRGFDWRDEEISRQREEIDAKDARIKELEEANRNIDKRRDEMAAFIERLEAALLDSLAARLYYEHYPGVSDAYSWHDYPEDACHCMPKEKFREKAHEALERIKEG